MSVRDLRQEFERQLMVAQKVMLEDQKILSHPDMADQRHLTPKEQELMHAALRASSTPVEGRPMAAPNAIKGLPGKFRDLLAGLTARAEKLAGEVEGSVKNLHARFDDADKFKREIDNTAAEMHQIVGMDNGGPEK